MMAAAVLAVTLSAANVAPNVAPLAVQGPSQCPTAAEVAAILPELLPPTEASSPDIAWIGADGLDLQIELRSRTGEVLSSRRVTSSGTCADLATIAAVVIASWTAERNPGISLMQPGVVEPPKPVLPPPPSVAAQPRPINLAPPAQPRTQEFDLSFAAGGSANSAGIVGAARVEAGVCGPRFGLRAGFSTETERSEPVAPGTVSWRRYGLSLGPTVALVGPPVRLDARAEIFAGFTSVSGHGFTVDRQSSAVSPGLSLALRLGTTAGWLRPWIEAGGQSWLANQEIVITRDQQPNAKVPLPRFEARFFAGVSIVLSR